MKKGIGSIWSQCLVSVRSISVNVPCRNDIHAGPKYIFDDDIANLYRCFDANRIDCLHAFRNLILWNVAGCLYRTARFVSTVYNNR